MKCQHIYMMKLQRNRYKPKLLCLLFIGGLSLIICGVILMMRYHFFIGFSLIIMGTVLTHLKFRKKHERTKDRIKD